MTQVMQSVMHGDKEGNLKQLLKLIDPDFDSSKALIEDIKDAKKLGIEIEEK